ncbi:hypothetical protein H9P43_000181 [Blastocladiella emersonii ATCC 22665]|nr:hypothetical protein H9P43_000181 [Blastocladiella emersonii ATCC 22665]
MKKRQQPTIVEPGAPAADAVPVEVEPAEQPVDVSHEEEGEDESDDHANPLGFDPSRVSDTPRLNSRSRSAPPTRVVGPLPTDAQLAGALSMLGQSAGGGFGLVFRKLSLPGANVTDISFVRRYPCLEYLELPSNAINDVSALASLPYLFTLDLSDNRLAKFEMATEPVNLQYLDLSRNQLTSIGELGKHRYLRHLSLDRNLLKSIQGLHDCRFLTHLSVVSNAITSLSGLEGLPIQFLDLRRNRISSLTETEHLPDLTELHLSHNTVPQLRGQLSLKCTKLAVLAVDTNGITNEADVLHLQKFPSLRVLKLRGNPLAAQPQQYRLRTLFHLPRLQVLDGLVAGAEEKVAAQNAFDPPAEVVEAVIHAHALEREAALYAPLLTPDWGAHPRDNRDPANATATSSSRSSVSRPPLAMVPSVLSLANDSPFGRSSSFEAGGGGSDSSGSQLDGSGGSKRSSDGEDGELTAWAGSALPKSASGELKMRALYASQVRPPPSLYFNALGLGGKPCPFLPLVVCGPAGVGKRTLTARLLAEFPQIFGVCISHTTRRPRAGERHGVDYYFVSRDEMDAMMRAGKMASVVAHLGHLYGTSTESCERVRNEGKIGIVGMEIEGAMTLYKAQFAARFVYVAPPSIEALQARLQACQRDRGSRRRSLSASINSVGSIRSSVGGLATTVVVPLHGQQQRATSPKRGTAAKPAVHLSATSLSPKRGPRDDALAASSSGLNKAATSGSQSELSASSPASTLRAMAAAGMAGTSASSSHLGHSAASSSTNLPGVPDMMGWIAERLEGIRDGAPVLHVLMAPAHPPPAPFECVLINDDLEASYRALRRIAMREFTAHYRAQVDDERMRLDSACGLIMP